MCDDCFGSGKTSMIWKFRQELSRMEKWERPDGYAPLFAAVYVHCRFDDIPASRMPDAEKTASIDNFLLHHIKNVLLLSFNRADLKLNCDSLDEFVVSVNNAAGEAKFLVHFDDVGVFEKYSIDFGRKLLYRMWKIGEALRTANHFYVMTGRSSSLCWYAYRFCRLTRFVPCLGSRWLNNFAMVQWVWCIP